MVENLFDWAKDYFKHRDIFEKKLNKINKEKDRLILNYKDRKDVAFISAVFEDELFEKLSDIKKYKKRFIVCSYSQTNISFLIKNWKKFLIENLILIFIDVRINKRVLINPYIHNKISDPDNLKAGILSLFSEK
jgi:hypothetical protein